MMDILPSFTMAGYELILKEILFNGFVIKPSSSLGDQESESVYLRHDVDFSVINAVGMAGVENRLGISATYYVLLSGPYNVFHPRSSAAIQKLVNLGHDIGLHYDLRTYPGKKDEAAATLDVQISILESITRRCVRTIVMHEPFRRRGDIFLEHRNFVNPGRYQQTDLDLRYVSDSCRAWRDDSLLVFLRREAFEKRLLLNIHPELWLATKRRNRIRYLDETLIPAVLEENRRYFSETVRQVWLTHDAAVSGYGDEDEA